MPEAFVVAVVLENVPVPVPVALNVTTSPEAGAPDGSVTSALMTDVDVLFAGMLVGLALTLTLTTAL
jgi:hypothetical protein